MVIREAGCMGLTATSPNRAERSTRRGFDDRQRHVPRRGSAVAAAVYEYGPTLTTNAFGGTTRMSACDDSKIHPTMAATSATRRDTCDLRRVPVFRITKRFTVAWS